jgi:hypothetical protein
MKKSIMRIVFLCLLLAIPSVSFAHSPSTGGESSKWSVDAYNHAGTTGVSYSFGSVSSSHKTTTDTGAGRWDIAAVHFGWNAVGGTGTITEYSDSNSSTLAAFYNYTSNSSGHLTKWYIKINNPVFDGYSATIRNATMAHEFGHAVGLNDLYSSSNKDVVRISRWMDCLFSNHF